MAGDRNAGAPGAARAAATPAQQPPPSGALPCAKPPAHPTKLPLSEMRAQLKQIAAKARPCVGLIPRVGSAPDVFVTYTDRATLTASSLAMFGLTFDGVVTLPSRNGPIRLLKFTVERMVFTNADLTARRSPIMQRATARSVTFRATTQRVAFYTTRFSVTFLGVPFTFTPASPPLIVLPNVVFTNVTAEHPVITADRTNAVKFAETSRDHMKRR